MGVLLYPIAVLASVALVLVGLLKWANASYYDEGRWQVMSAVGGMLLIVSASAAFVNGCGANYTNGTLTGYVVKFGQSGLVWRTWEGTIHLGQSSTGASTNDQRFSVTDPAVATQIEDAQAQGEKVDLSFSEWVASPARLGSDHEVTAVQVEQ